jgi:hypothetical protein
MHGQKIEKHWKIRGPHNMICQELFWGVRVDHHSVREHNRNNLRLNPKTFRQEDEVDIYAQPNYAAGPFFSELILNNPRAKKERWNKTPEVRKRKAENKRKRKEPVRAPLYVPFCVRHRIEGEEKAYRIEQITVRCMYYSGNNSVQFGPKDIKIYAASSESS